VLLNAAPEVLSQSISSKRSLDTTLLHPHSSTSNVQSPDVAAAIWGAAALQIKYIK